MRDDSAFRQAIREAVSSLLPSLPPGTLLGLLTFGNTVSLYDLSQQGQAEARSLSGRALPSDDDLAWMLGDEMVRLGASVEVV